MAWKANPRTITKEQFSEGTTIDGNRIDNAMDDVVERVNSVPYGDLRKRWVPITYVAGWTPQSPATLEMSSGDTAESDKGEIAGTHHWPWMRVLNTNSEVVSGTLGALATDDLRFSNPYRLKGAQAPGVFPYGRSVAAETSYTPSLDPVGEQFAWTRSWFIERPSILSAIDLILEVDHVSAPRATYLNSFVYGDVPPTGYAADSNDRGLVITAAVDSEFAREDRNMADVEVLRRRFQINNDKVSPLPLAKTSAGDSPLPAYDDFAPAPGISHAASIASTVQGVRISLGHIAKGEEGLNIPIHQRARLRVSVVIPSYTAAMRPCGWNPAGNSGAYPWFQQKMHMTVTMLEEVVSG